MYNNPYANTYGYMQQGLGERIDAQIAQLNQMKDQIKNNGQPAINQTFQLAPTSNQTMKFVNTIDEVAKESVYSETPFFSKDMSVLWVKDTKGDIKTYEMKEIIQKDDKDLLIDSLQLQINDLRKELKYAKSNNHDGDEPIKNEKPTNVSNAKPRKNQSGRYIEADGD